MEAVLEKRESCSGKSAAPQRSMEERQIIERAKQLLMSRWALSEPQAHRTLQHMSMDSATPLVTVAQNMIAMLEE